MPITGKKRDLAKWGKFVSIIQKQVHEMRQACLIWMIVKRCYTNSLNSRYLKNSRDVSRQLINRIFKEANVRKREKRKRSKEIG